MIRASLLWLLAGAGVGGLMLADRSLRGDWVAWFLPTHAHMLLVGWLVQFALAVAFWLFPRKRTPARPLGYDERAAMAAAGALNLGLLTRSVVEPLARGGLVGGDPAGSLALAAALQVSAIALFVVQLWPRAAPRARVEARPRTGEA